MMHARLDRPGTEHQAATLSLIGAGCGHGAPDHGCRQGPEHLRGWGLDAALGARGFVARWSDILQDADATDSLSSVEAVGAFDERLAVLVQRVVSNRERFVVVGGDHSCAVGTWRGVARGLGNGTPPGLLWIDAHMDSHTPETSPSGALHGMPLACLLGEGPRRLRAIPGPLLDPARICLVGVRSYESAEAELMERLGVRVFPMEEIRRRGVHEVLTDAVERVQSGDAGFGVTIDLDVLDPVEAPGVTSPVDGGLGLDELVGALRRCVADRGPLGVEIAEYNPARDRANATAHAVGRLAAACFAFPGRRRKGRRWPPRVASRSGR